MRIALDAKWYHKGPPGGRTYVRGIVDEILRDDRGIEWILFLRESDPPFETSGKVESRNLSIDNTFLRAKFQLKPAAEKAGANAIVSHTIATNSKNALNVPIVYDVLFKSHPELFTFRERTYFNQLAKTVSRADAAITISRFSRDEIVRHLGLSKEKILLCYPGVSDRFSGAVPAEEDRKVLADAKVKGPYVLYVGRLNVRKNVPVLLEAWKDVASRDHTLVLIGAKDESDARIDPLLRDPLNSSRVKHIPWVSDDALPAFYRSADAFVYLPTAEGFGLPPIEAMKAGTPVICSKAESLLEICDEAAMMIDINPSELRFAIDRVLHDSDLRFGLVAKGFKRAERFTWQRCVDDLANGLDGLMRNRA
ncbi:MAG: glycosyltransferase family 4 protein [Planctomycetes bacterium]|nr:glycosyltransferase family 4 protein [Planctomycetota bacterium]